MVKDLLSTCSLQLTRLFGAGMEVAELMVLTHPRPSTRHFSPHTERYMEEVFAFVGMTGSDVAVS